MMVRRTGRAVLAVAILGALMTFAAPAPDVNAAATTELGVGDVAVWEGNTGNRTMQFAITLSQPSTGVVTVTATVAPGTASTPTDYKVAYGATKTVTFKAGQTYKPFAVAVVPDAADEADETLTLTLSNPSSGIALGRSIGSGTILDDDPGSGVRLAVGDVSAVEGDSGVHRMAFWITLSEPAAGAVTAQATITGSTATAGVDFKPSTKLLSFRPGQVKKPFIVNVLPDIADEPDESLALNLSAVSGATLLDGSGAGTIHDDDGAVTVQTATFRLGPFVLAPEGSAGSESDSAQSNIPKPSGAFGVTGMRFDLVHGDGASEGHHNVHFHHAVFMDSSRPDSLCPSLPNRFVGAGAERTPVSFGTEYAYKVGATDQWSALWHIMNTSTATHTVYLEYEIDYITGADLAAAKPLTSYFYDVDNCWGDSEYDVPGGGGAGSVHSKSITYTAPKNGTRLYTGGHLHDGGIDLSLEQNGTEVCRPTASYMDMDGMPMLEAISYCDTPVAVAAGSAVRLTSRYSNENPIPGAMGISVSYVWEP